MALSKKVVKVRGKIRKKRSTTKPVSETICLPPESTGIAANTTEALGALGAQPSKPVYSPEDRAKLVKEAIAEILAGISEPHAQTLCTFVPPEWHSKYRPVLGQYRRFCLRHSDTFEVVKREAEGYIIIKSGTEPPATRSRKSPLNWKFQLQGAWSSYCEAIGRHARNIDEFRAALQLTEKKRTDDFARQEDEGSAPTVVSSHSLQPSAVSGSPPGKCAKGVKRKKRKRPAAATASAAPATAGHRLAS